MTWTETVGRMQDDVLDIFAETVTYDPKDSASFQIEADFHRPHELVEDVRGRMAKRGVASLIVTKPTGELLGEFMAHDPEASP